MNLDQHVASRRLSFIDVLSQLRSETTLRSLYDVVQTHLHAAGPDEGPALVILDDVSVLEWLGYSTTELFRFLRALTALCRKVRNACTTGLPTHDSVRTTMHLLSDITLSPLAIQTISYAICYNSRHTTLTYDRCPVGAAGQYLERYATLLIAIARSMLIDTGRSSCRSVLSSIIPHQVNTAKRGGPVPPDGHRRHVLQQGNECWCSMKRYPQPRVSLTGRPMRYDGSATDLTSLASATGT